MNRLSKKICFQYFTSATTPQLFIEKEKKKHLPYVLSPYCCNCNSLRYAFYASIPFYFAHDVHVKNLASILKLNKKKEETSFTFKNIFRNFIIQFELVIGAIFLGREMEGIFLFI